MEERTFTDFCIAACIFMILVNLSFSVVGALNVFNTHVPTYINGKETGTENETKFGITNPSTLFSGTGLVDFVLGLPIWVLLGAAGISMICGAMGTWNLLGAYLFGVVFWTTWGTTQAVFTYQGFFNNPVLQTVMLLVTFGMMFIFIGAAWGIIRGHE